MDLDLSSLDEPLDIRHEFETDLHCVVLANHGFTLEAIDRSEEEDLTSIQKGFELENHDTITSMMAHHQTFYDDLRQAAHRLALVALVTRLQHWTERFVAQLKVLYMMLPDEMLALLDRWTVPNSVSAIAITFEGTTIFVFHDDLDRLKTLENALSLGGSAVGMVGTIHNGDHVYIYRKSYGDDEDFDHLLQKCQEGMIANIQKKFSGGTYIEIAPPRRHTLLIANGWLLEFLTDDETSCPKCNEPLVNCACGFLVDMTPDELVERGFARYIGKKSEQM